MTRPTVFIDTETLGLNPYRHALWEIALIRREPDGTETEHLWQLRPSDIDMFYADPKALAINRFRERMQVPPDALALDMLAPGGPAPIDPYDLDTALITLLDGAELVGSNPAFDARFLRMRLGRSPWHYRTIDIATLAGGFLLGRAHAQALADPHRTPTLHQEARQAIAGWRSYQLSAAVGVQPPGEDAAHTAMGDARWARAVYDAIIAPPADPATSSTPPACSSSACDDQAADRRRAFIRRRAAFTP